jgi:MSHA type pilus biogenesis protein MshL
MLSTSYPTKNSILKQCVRLIFGVGFAMVMTFAGCTWGPSSVLKPRKHEPDQIPNQMAAESERLARIQDQLMRSMESVKPRPVVVEPVVPTYDPFEGQTVSFSVVDEPLQTVLYSLSQAAGVNIILDPTVMDETRRLTLNFENASASLVLEEILSAYDLHYEVTGNIVKVTPYMEKIFRLDFLDAVLDAKFEVGGDVLGAGDTESTSGLSGSFTLTGGSVPKNNPYTMLENLIRPVLSQDGKFSINRLAGSLYVKDRPRAVRSVAHLVRHYRSMLSRQILIEARIIEVILSDQYQYGIDWSILKNLDNAATELTQAAWSLGEGLILTGTKGDYSIGSAVDALNVFGDAKVVSNPTIRSKHGQPAIISVGTSFTYKKSVETTRYSYTSGENVSTDVEVSTVFDGLILGVIPFIDEHSRVTLLINPIKSDVDQESLEEQQIGEDLSISLPRVRVKEISSTISLNDGDIIVLGGLIDKEKVTDNRGVPFLSGIPLLGYLFKDEGERDDIRELVILLKVKVV